MTPDQAEQLVARIVATWRGRLSSDARAVWAKALGDLDHQAAAAAVDRLAGTEAHMPSVAQIILTAATPGRANGARVEWEVLVHWLDPKGAWQADRRWHTTPEAARADFSAHALRAGPGVLVELLEHTDGRPVRTIDQAHGPMPEPAA